MMTTGKKFVLLLRCGMGIPLKEEMPVIDSEEEWQMIMQLAKEQTVQGVLNRGIMSLPEELQPPRKIRLRSYMRGSKISDLNKQANDAAIHVVSLLREAGFTCCLLKGQGNALCYPEPSARVPGDIDVWVNGPIMEVARFARKTLPNAFACYHHIEYVKVDGVEVELHYRPSFLNNFVHNHRLQRWFSDEADRQCANRIDLSGGVGMVSIPTDAFNRIFQMAHMMNHIIHEGLGMRQLTDYYFLLMRGFTEEERRQDELLLRRFGLYNLTGAVMYVLKWLFALPEEKMIVKPDKRIGTVLLKDVLNGGNFGRYDKNAQKVHSQLDRNLMRLKRDWRLLKVFPSECLSEPLFRLYHFFWRCWLNIYI